MGEQIVTNLTQVIELVALNPRREAEVAPLTRRAKLFRFFRINFAMLLIVALPTAISAVYFGFIAADRYESRSAFVVRTSSGSEMGALASLLQGTGIVSSIDDAYIVADYMQSRDAMHHLVENDDLLSIFTRPEGDFLSRYGGTLSPLSEEKLYRFYKNFVSISFDRTTGISTLSVEAFRPEDARNFANALLRDSELLLNKLNERSVNDALKTASEQLDRAKAVAYQAQKKVTDFRSKESVIDPTRMSTSVVETVGKLSLESAMTNAQLAELMTSSPSSPQIPNLRLRISALENQIAKERLALAGSDLSYAPLIADYERLTLDVDFATKAYASALSSLELARVEALRQRIFLEQVTKPNLPDYPKYPYRILWIVVTLVASFLVYSIFRKFLIDIISHAKP